MASKKGRLSRVGQRSGSRLVQVEEEGAPELRMQSLEQVTKQLTEGRRKVAEALHAVATFPGFTVYERVYVTFKLTEQIAWSLRSPADDEEDDDGPE